MIERIRNGIKIGEHILIYKNAICTDEVVEIEKSLNRKLTQKLNECTKEELIYMHILRDWNPRWNTESALVRMRRERTERKIAEMLKRE